MTKQLYLLLILIGVVGTATAQNNEGSSPLYENTIRGIVLDGANNEPLLYTNIFVDNQSRGVISNEKGMFAFDVTGLHENDSMCFQYLGYKMVKLSIAQLRQSSTIRMFEDDINLVDIVVFGNAPDPKGIVEKVLENKAKNYPEVYSKMNAFIRDRETSTVNSLKLDYKKSTINNIDRKLVEDLEKSIPRNTTSYTDFLGNLYFGKKPLPRDSIVKVDAIKAVSLRDKDMADMDRIEKVMEESFVGLNPDEYWRLKSGIFAVKVDEGQPESDEKQEADTAKVVAKEEKPDTASRESTWLKYYTYSIDWKFHFPSMNSRSDWEFLYEPNRYNYKLERRDQGKRRRCVYYFLYSQIERRFHW